MSEAILGRMQKATAARVNLTDDKTRKFLTRPVAPRTVRGDVGLELEVEAVGLPGIIDYVSPVTVLGWDQHKDGSLRGESTEYVLEGPINNDEVDGAVDALFDSFKKAKTKLLLSNRCSTHVHLNFSHLTPRPITSFVALWTIVEEAVTNWCGHHRVSNPFAMRAVDSTTTIDLWEQLLGGARIQDFGPDQRDREQRYKYGALNLLPLYQYGSIEIRSLRGAEKRQMVKTWVRFLWALREEARSTYQNPMMLAMQVSANDALGIVEQIIEKHGLQDFWAEVAAHPDNFDLRGMLRRGFLLIQPMLFGTKWELGKDGEELSALPEDGVVLRERQLRQRDRDAMIARRERQQLEQQQMAEMDRQHNEAMAAQGLDRWGNPLPEADEAPVPRPKPRRAKPFPPEPAVVGFDMERAGEIFGGLRPAELMPVAAGRLRRPNEPVPQPEWINDPFNEVVNEVPVLDDFDPENEPQPEAVEVFDDLNDEDE